MTTPTSTSGKLSNLEQQAAAETKIVRTEADRAAVAAARTRIPFGVPNVRPSIEIPGHDVSYINDLDGHIERALAGGYEFVTRTEINLPPSLEVFSPNSDLGERVSHVAGTLKSGHSYRAYAMKIRKEFKDEDRSILRQRRSTRLASIKQGRATNDVDRNFYVPQGSPISIGDKNKP